MFQYTEPFETIREAQLSLLDDILHSGDLVEETIEINNVVMTITNPLKYSGNLLGEMTKTSQKFYSQMMLEPDPNLEKTHYCRLNDWREILEDKSTSILTQHFNQIQEVINKLKEKSTTRRCVISLWKPQDVSDPYALCWTHAQLLLRRGRLDITVFFRSNDIYNAFPFNMLGIAKLQERIANDVGVRCGDFNIIIGSAHIYNKNIQASRDLIGYESPQKI